MNARKKKEDGRKVKGFPGFEKKKTGVYLRNQ